jgi:hypothetical protein
MMATVIARASPTNVTQCRRCACERSAGSLRPGRSPFTIQHGKEKSFSRKCCKKGSIRNPSTVARDVRCRTLPNGVAGTMRLGEDLFHRDHRRARSPRCRHRSNTRRNVKTKAILLPSIYSGLRAAAPFLIWAMIQLPLHPTIIAGETGENDYRVCSKAGALAASVRPPSASASIPAGPGRSIRRCRFRPGARARRRRWTTLTPREVGHCHQDAAAERSPPQRLNQLNLLRLS